MYTQEEKKGHDIFADEAERKKYFPYPDYAISTSSGEVYVRPKDLMNDPEVKEQVKELIAFVRERGLIKKTK